MLFRSDLRRKNWVNTDPPRQIATTMLAGVDRWPFPRVAGVVTSPLLRADGTLVVNADGSFRYTPPTGYVGTITFAVRASDGVDNSALKWVTIEVQAPYGLRRSR